MASRPNRVGATSLRFKNLSTSLSKYLGGKDRARAFTSATSAASRSPCAIGTIFESSPRAAAHLASGNFLHRRHRRRALARNQLHRTWASPQDCLVYVAPHPRSHALRANSSRSGGDGSRRDRRDFQRSPNKAKHGAAATTTRSTSLRWLIAQQRPRAVLLAIDKVPQGQCCQSCTPTSLARPTYDRRSQRLSQRHCRSLYSHATRLFTAFSKRIPTCLGTFLSLLKGH